MLSTYSMNYVNLGNYNKFRVSKQISYEELGCNTKYIQCVNNILDIDWCTSVRSVGNYYTNTNTAQYGLSTAFRDC